MKKSILFSILFATIILFSCKKENNQPNNGNGTSTPPPITTGTLYFKNIQIYPYTIYIDGVSMGTLSSNSISIGYIVTSGISHAVKSQQSTGYILYPTIFTGTATLNPGGSITWSF